MAQVWKFSESVKHTRTRILLVMSSKYAPTQKVHYQLSMTLQKRKKIDYLES